MAEATESKKHYRTCNLCEAMCGIEITYQEKTIESIRGDDKDPFSRGHICPKATALQDIYEDPNRLKHPVKRTASGWEKISWEQAFDETASRLKDIQKKHGKDAVSVYFGNPNVHNYGTALFGPALLRTLRTKNRFSATSLDQLPHMLVSSMMFGHQLMLPIPDIDRTDFFVIMGGNPVVSNGSIMSSPDIKKRLKAIQKRGGKVVVIDPRRTETARLADQHIFIKPGSDVLLVLAILDTIIKEELTNTTFLAPHLEGLETFLDAVQGFSAEKVSEATGVPTETILELARSFAKADSAAWYGRMGTCVQHFGALNQWLIYGLNILTGNLDRPGGMMFTHPAVDVIGAGFAGRGSYNKWQSRIRSLPSFGGELPASVMVEEMTTPGEGQIRAMLTSAGNPVLSSPNGRELEKALEGLDFMVSIDFYINETTRFADIILPPTSALEHENYDLVFHLLAIRNTAKFSPALFEPEEDTRHDWEIFMELQSRLAGGSAFTKIADNIKKAGIQWIGAEGMLDWALRFGPYGAKMNPLSGGLSLKKLKKSPHGVDLGPLRTSVPERLRTRSQKIQMAHDVLQKDLDRVHTTFFSEDKKDAPYLLIGRRQLRSNNSWMHNYKRLVKGKNRCTLLLHPEDAERENLTSGQWVTVKSRVGELKAEVEVSDEIMKGVVSLPHGWGHDREGIQLDVAKAHPGVSINDLTDDQDIDPVSGNAVLNGVPVQLQAIPDA